MGVVICKKHGCQPFMCVSHDAIDAEGLLPRGLELTKVEFNYEGSPCLWYYLSPTTAHRLGFASDAVLSLPDDDFPPWVDDVQWWALCDKCFQVTR